MLTKLKANCNTLQKKEEDNFIKPFSKFILEKVAN